MYFSQDLLIAFNLFISGWPDLPRIVKGKWMSRLGALCFLYHRIGSYIPALGCGTQVYFMNTNDQCTTLQLSCIFALEGFNSNPAADQLVHIWFWWAWWVAIKSGVTPFRPPYGHTFPSTIEGYVVNSMVQGAWYVHLYQRAWGILTAKSMCVRVCFVRVVFS